MGEERWLHNKVKKKGGIWTESENREGHKFRTTSKRGKSWLRFKKKKKGNGLKPPDWGKEGKEGRTEGKKA